MDDFSVKPGVPNMYGAVGGKLIKYNREKMLSSMTPTVVLKDGKSKNGSRNTRRDYTTSVFQAIVDVIDFKQNANFSVNAPKFHHQWLPEVVKVENKFPETTIKALEKKNYKFEKFRILEEQKLLW
jgi:gamma-glutamyltranspeptidase/glutathione hydrolase